MAGEPQLLDISHTIQLAVAPVFLLSAISTTLGVLTTRLGRIVDRARKLEDRLAAEPAAGTGPADAAELRQLARRARFIHWALTLGTGSALFVCLTIAVAFVGFMLDVRLGNAIALLFVAAVAAYVGALLFFLREVMMAIRTLTFAHPPEGDDRSGGA